MTAFRAQRFKAGDVLNNWSADLLNNMGRAAEMVLNLKVQAPLTIVQTGDRLTLGVGQTSSFQQTATEERTVVIVKAPADADEFLLVRQVRYTGEPPVPCAGENPVVCKISYMGEPFAAAPEFGTKSKDFKGLEEDREVPPGDGATFFHARTENGYWILDASAKGGSAVEHVVIREVTTGRLVSVQAIALNNDTLVWEAVGPVFDALAKPGLTGADYFAYKWPGPLDAELTRFMPCYKIRGSWRLGWDLDVPVELLPSNVRFTDCRPASRAGDR